MNELITAIDIGTTKISFAIGKLSGGRFEVVFLKGYPSSGLKKGKVVDMEALTSSIKRALMDVESALNIKIRRALVCCSGSDIGGTYSNAAVRIRKGQVTEEDVDFIMESATAISIPAEKEIIHSMPVEFILDGVGGIKDPVGMRGVRLEVKVFIVTASLNHIQNIITCCNKAGIEVSEVILNAIASSEAVLTQHDREIGTLVADIGAGTIDMAVFYDGYLRDVATLGIGGSHITNDLAIGLKIPVKEAERIKTEFGVSLPEISFGYLRVKEPFSDEQSSCEIKKEIMKDKIIKGLKGAESLSEIEIIGLDKNPVRIPLRIVNDIVYARVEEIFEVIKKQISSLPEEISISSIVFTGGASLMKGLIPLAEGFLSVPSRVGKPDTGIAELCYEMGLEDFFIDESKGVIDNLNPGFCSVIGCLIYSVRAGYASDTVSNGFGRIFNKFGQWLRSLIKI